jgi:excisionase family DNA binding protein
MNELHQHDNRALTLREAAEILCVCVRTVRREIERGALVAFRVGRSLRIRMSELQRYIEQHTIGIHA